MADTVNMTCGGCGNLVAGQIIAQGESFKSQTSLGVKWLRCPHCGDGSVLVKSGAVHPTGPVTAPIENLPSDVAAAWMEANRCYAVGSFTAAEMMCRKILMHLAVDVANGKEGGSFVSFVDALDKAGYISTGVRPAVEQVKERGNRANHDLAASLPGEASLTIRITEHLLRGVYEMSVLP